MRILIICDDQEARTLMTESLVGAHFRVAAVSGQDEGLRRLHSSAFDLILLDLNLPSKNRELCDRIRKQDVSLPIMIVSRATEPRVKADLLNSGADDYLNRPYAFEELLARSHALLRRRSCESSAGLSVGDLSLDPQRHAVTRGGKKIKLTPKEFTLLEYLMRNRGAVLSRMSILEHVWDMCADPFSNTIEAHIMSLRRKIDRGYPKKDRLIHTAHGIGYRLDTDSV